MFYTPSTLTVSQGQKVSGTLSCAPNARNNRDLDISIAYEVEPLSGAPVELQKGEFHYKMYVSDLPRELQADSTLGLNVGIRLGVNAV